MRLQALGAAGEPGLTELASGIDALYMSGHGEVSARLLAELEAAKVRAQEDDSDVALSLGGVAARLEPRSFGRYAYRLKTEHGLIGLMASSTSPLPPVRMQPRADHLHAVGPRASVAWFEGLVGSFTGGLRTTVARLDVFSDWHGFALTADDRKRFVCRAKRCDTHEDGEALTGFEFGRRNTHTLAARIYDKSVDMKRTGNLWWPDVWGTAYDPERQVVRVEIELGRKGLTQYGVDSIAQALEAAPSLWLTATTDWLTLRKLSVDATKARWPVDPVWAAIQRPSFAEHAISLERVLEARGQASMDRLMPLVTGCLSSFCALIDARSVDEAVGPLRRRVREYCERSDYAFEDRIADKRSKLRFA